jgi:hypothetical protein
MAALPSRSPAAVLLGAALALLAAALACALPAGPVSDREATVQAFGSAVAASATADRLPTATALPTGIPDATEVIIALTADTSGAETQVAIQATELAIQAATATVVAPILAELPVYGVDPALGRPAWVHPPVDIDVEGFEQFAYANRFAATVVTDFVVAADITWNTQFGTSGCGLVLRSDGNEDALSQYLVVATRGGNGRVLFTVMERGEVIEVYDMFARRIDPLFQSANDTTNRLAVVGRGSTFQVYTNGTLIGQVQDDRYDIGFVALVALNQSGTTHCGYSNTWLWRFNQN